MPDKITIYTDGGCTNNPGAGGWAAVFLNGTQVIKEISGGDPATTNSRMELVAVIRALEQVLLEFGKEQPVSVVTDSEYVSKGISEWIVRWMAKGWRTASGKPVKNQDLWVKLKKLEEQLPVQWNWVRGHSGVEWNERCDELVFLERTKFE